MKESTITPTANEANNCAPINSKCVEVTKSSEEKIVDRDITKETQINKSDVEPCNIKYQMLSEECATMQVLENENSNKLIIPEDIKEEESINQETSSGKNLILKSKHGFSRNLSATRYLARNLKKKSIKW
ncbi:hypothetical protein WA026_016879 [Henosepilachna vigintioctopunctata]|uniref:Uncharacterized protein n=1 Tax=Henosepilachna vigintioctopunctata TaxID=420089 RepID=A0AAW1U3T4_9CUCU